MKALTRYRIALAMLFLVAQTGLATSGERPASGQNVIMTLSGEAIVKIVSSGRVLEQNVLVDLEVRGTGEKVETDVTITCVGETPQEQQRCEDFGVIMADELGAACSSIEGGVECVPGDAPPNDGGGGIPA
jgi:hypothetical protein